MACKNGHPGFFLHNREISRAAFDGASETILVEFQNGDAQTWNLQDGRRCGAERKSPKLYAEITSLGETHFVESATKTVVARLPLRFLQIAPHLPTLTWAGSIGDHIGLYTLEGVDKEIDVP